MPNLSGKRILIVEDELIVAMVLEDMLTDLGATDIRSASSVPDAMALIAAYEFDVGILDINLSGRLSTEIADALKARGVPIIYATGYDGGGGVDTVVLQKPYTQADVSTALKKVLSSQP